MITAGDLDWLFLAPEYGVLGETCYSSKAYTDDNGHIRIVLDGIVDLTMLAAINEHFSYEEGGE